MNKYHTYSFEKLEVWQIARKIRVDIYKLTSKFPHTELYNITSQLKRAVGSVCANLVEGSARSTDKDKGHYTNMAYASALEVLDHLIASFDWKYISEEEYIHSRKQLDELINKTNAYYKYQIYRNSTLKNHMK
jgi:four helix bundle protein